MKQGVLKLEQCGADCYHTVFKTQHGRLIYLALRTAYKTQYRITDCCYIDRTKSYTPKKLKTFCFKQEQLLTTIAEELDRRFYGVTIEKEGPLLSREDFIEQKIQQLRNGYQFLIMVGEGTMVNGLPSVLTTRFKSKLHRSIYLKLMCDEKGRGVVASCYYFDRKYSTQHRKVTPPSLYTVFFRYNKNTILTFVNSELNAEFTHLLVVSGEDINIEHNRLPICGNI